MNKMLVLLLVLSPLNALADASQQLQPGNKAPPDSQQPIPAVNPNPVLNSGGIGPNTIPTNINTNGTVDTTPAILNGSNNNGTKPTQ